VATVASGGAALADGYQFAPAVAFDGTNYLVAWQDGRGTYYDVYGARVSPAGAVLDPAGIAISTAGNHQEAPSVTFDGTNHLGAWQDSRSGTSWDTYGARVSPAGAVLDPGGLAISTESGQQLTPTLAFDGTNYLVAWEDSRFGQLAGESGPDTARSGASGVFTRGEWAASSGRARGPASPSVVASRSGWS